MVTLMVHFETKFSEANDPLEIMLICWFAAQETFIIINSCAA